MPQMVGVNPEVTAAAVIQLRHAGVCPEVTDRGAGSGPSALVGFLVRSDI